MTIDAPTSVRRSVAADPRVEEWSTDGPGGTVRVEAAAAGAHLGPLTRPGEVELRVPDGAPVRVLPQLVDAVAARARARYAVAVVIDTGHLPDGVRRLTEDLGFRPDGRAGRDGPARGAVRVLDLSIADDGTPTRVLDNPALASLNGHHARFAERRGEVARYLPDVSVWTGAPSVPSEQDWADVATLLGPGAVFGVGPRAVLPDGWEPVEGARGVQLTGEAITGAPDAEAVELTDADVPEMTDLVARTKPGPFLPRTVELGSYLGIRRDGRLVAMAGERLHPPGWTEISAVCTDPAYRGQGLGRRLVLAVAHGIRQRGETPMLHAAAENTGAIRLYEHLGFRLRDRGAARFVQVP